MKEEKYEELVKEFCTGHRNCNVAEEKIRWTDAVLMDFWYTKLKDFFDEEK